MENNKVSASLSELETQIESRISEFNQRRSGNKKNNKGYSWALLISSSLTTLFIAINMKFDYAFLAIIAIITNTLSLLFGNILERFKYKDRMISEIRTICDLRELQFNIIMHKRNAEDDTNKKITVSDISHYQEKYQNILDTANGSWRNNFISKSDSKDDNNKNT
ncbi:hypothetical protein AB7W62_07780 [Morganella morganii]|uniref:hypothetical protein n=1 Tax=Morganella morganii TaxID=582 RepID=UPI0021A68B7F|nr:hypothetical protein [Morganella morganii]